MDCCLFYKAAVVILFVMIIFFFIDRRRTFHEREKVINESSESRESTETGGDIHVQTGSMMPYEQLMHAIAKKSFPNVAIAVQDILTNQEPILNKRKLALYLETIKTQNVPIIREVMSAIRPCALFPKHYKYILMMKAMATWDSDIVDAVCKQMLPRFKLSKEDTVRLLREALGMDDIRPMISICASLKNKRAVERDHAFCLLLQAVKSGSPTRVVYILRVLRPKKALTVQQSSTLMISSIESGSLEIVQIALKIRKKYPTKVIEKCLYQALTSNTDIFLHLIHELKPRISDLALEELLNIAYIINGNREATCHILRHYRPPSHVASKFLKVFMRDNDKVLVPVILTYVANLTNEEVQRICRLSLDIGTNLFISFTGTHSCHGETITELVADHFHQAKIENGHRAMFQTEALPDTIVHLIRSLQYSESNIMKNLLLLFAKSGNVPALQLFCNSFMRIKKEKHIINVVETLLSIPSDTKAIENLLSSVRSLSPKLLAKLDAIVNKSKVDPNLIEMVQHYRRKLKHVETEL